MVRTTKCCAILSIAALVLGSPVSASGAGRGIAEVRFGDRTDQTIVRVLSWEGGVPELTEIRRPDGSSELRVFDREIMNSARWEPEAGSRGSRGTLVVAEAGIERRIAVSYRATAEGLAIELADEMDPSLRGTAVAIGLDPPNLPGERIGTHHPILVFFVAAALCAILQEDAMDECFENAVEVCGRGNVDYARYTGHCGVLGECVSDCVD